MAARPESTGRIFAGTSGWAYPSWKPGFYPKEVPARRFLEHYAWRLASVEVNYTFRTLPTPAQLGGWMDAAASSGKPNGSFRFSFKAPETITHRRRLRECADALERFLAAIAPAAERGMLGCVLFQLPPNFKADVERLRAFLTEPAFAAHTPQVAFEFRHVSWFADETYAVLRQAGAAVCIAESDDLQTPEVQTADGFSCYRLRMAGGYTEAAVAQHAVRMRALARAGRDVYVYYKHEDEPTGALAAESLLRLLA